MERLPLELWFRMLYFLDGRALVELAKSSRLTRAAVACYIDNVRPHLVPDVDLSAKNFDHRSCAAVITANRLRKIVCGYRYYPGQIFAHRMTTQGSLFEASVMQADIVSERRYTGCVNLDFGRRHPVEFDVNINTKCLRCSLSVPAGVSLNIIAPRLNALDGIPDLTRPSTSEGWICENERQGVWSTPVILNRMMDLASYGQRKPMYKRQTLRYACFREERDYLDNIIWRRRLYVVTDPIRTRRYEYLIYRETYKAGRLSWLSGFACIPLDNLSR